jgi:hypothetical protein
MIKKIHEITLADVILLDATKSANCLKKYWFVPLWLCRKELETLAKQIFEEIGGKTISNIQDDIDRLRGYRKLQILESLHKALSIEISLKSRINAWKLIMQKDFTESQQLQEVIEKVKKYSGIEINEPRDLKRFEDYIQFSVDKFQEMFTDKAPDDQEASPVNLSTVIYSVFNYMGEPHNRDMLLIDFITMKQMAEERIKQSKTQQDGQE